MLGVEHRPFLEEVELVAGGFDRFGHHVAQFHVVERLGDDWRLVRDERHGHVDAGHAPYSVAMLLREHFPELASWNLRILATELNKDILERARSGRFRQMDVNRGLPAQLLVKYFRERATKWEIREDIRTMVDFRELNLIKPWPSMDKPDLILLRNVMIYFDIPVKKMILSRIYDMLPAPSYLMLGCAETTLNLDDRFDRTVFGKAVCYSRRAVQPKP